MLAAPGSPAAKQKNDPPPTRDELLRWFRAVSSIGLYLPPMAAAVVSAKWSTFDMGVTVWMMGEFSFSIQRASLCFTCASLAFAICSPIMGYIGDKIPKHTMKWMVVVGLLLNVLNASSLQWTQSWQLQHRIVYAVSAWVGCLWLLPDSRFITASDNAI
jgi:MFS family permease